MNRFLTNGVIEVQSKDGRFLSRGTGWFLRPDVVVTALHVVGKLHPQLGWMHDVPGDKDATYHFVSAGVSKLALKPLCFDASADVALLQCEPPRNDAIKVVLADVFPTQAQWYADGLPGFDSKVEWTLSGKIVSVRGDRLQLVVDQGTQVSWQGVSGSALRVDHRVAGLITAETSGTNTVWAAAASAITRLLATYDAAIEATKSLGVRLEWNTDRETLLKSLDRVSKIRPETIGLRDHVAAIGINRPQWDLPSDVLEDLNSYGVGPVENGFTRLVRREFTETATHLYDPWDEFEDLFRGRYSADRFGGRTQQLRALDEFVETSGGGYFYITGAAGLGKTALLAEWLRCFRARGERPALHFITKAYKYLDDPRTEMSCLKSLCMQLLDLHQLGGNVPTEIDRLRKLYRRLLTLPPPPDERLVVVLDGLDEALPDWTPGTPMFPRPADRVKVICSAGPVANKDWARDLQLNLAPTSMQVLTPLRADEVGDVLRRAGVAQSAGVGFQSLCQTVYTVTQGDPDYVADVLESLLELIKEGKTDLVGAIERFPVRHSEYLRQWWSGAVEDLDKRGFGNAFDDLMGTLSVLREPFAAEDLVRVSDEDELRQGRIDTLLKYAGRYVAGDSRTGYRLVRPRVIELVNQQLEDRMKIYRRRVAEFCRRWNSPTKSVSARRYAVNNAVAHLLEQDDLDGVVALLDAGFIAAQWGVNGSYVSLLADMDRLLNFAQAHVDNREAVCRAAAFAVMRESARDLMRSLPTSLYACWIRLKGPSQITGLLNALPTYRGEARGPLLAIAKEIFAMFPAAEGGSANRAMAGELVGRTIGLLPFVRTALWKLEAWSEICRLLAKHSIERAQLKKIIEQAQSFIEHIAEQDADLKAACLAHLAKAILPWDQERSSRFLEQAEKITCDLPGVDRAMVYAIAFPVYRVLNPNRGEQLASETTAPLQAGMGLSRLSGAREPLIDLLAVWAQDPPTGPPVAAARMLAERHLADPRGRLWVVPPGLLLRFGLHDLAWRVLDAYKPNESDEFIARQLTNCLLTAPGQRDLLRPRIMSLYTDHVATPDVARALMHAGYWTEALAVVRRLSAKDVPTVVPEFLEIALGEPVSIERNAAVDVLVTCLDQTAGVHWEEGAARSALALARAGLPQARAVFGSVLGRSLARLPEGDADRIRYLLSVALSCTGEYDKAMAILHDCKSPTARMTGLIAVLKATQAGSEKRRQVTVEIKRELASVERDVSEAIACAREAAEVLSTVDPTEAAGLADAIENMRRRDLESLIAASEVRVLLDPSSGPSRAHELIDRMLSGEERPNREDIQAACSVVVRSAIQNRDAASSLIDRLLDWASGLDDGYRGQALAGLLGAVADFYPERFRKTLDEALKTLRSGSSRATTRSAIAAEQFAMLIGELTGTRWLWVNQFTSLLNGLQGAVSKLSESQLMDAFEATWAWLLSVPTGLDEFEAATNAYLAAVARLPTSHSSLAEQGLKSPLSALQGRLKPDQLSKFCGPASIQFAGKGHAKAAQRLLQYIQDDEEKRQVTEIIHACEFYYSLSDRSIVEEALFQKAEARKKGMVALTIWMNRKAHIGEAISPLIELLKQGSVRYELLDRAVFLAFTVLAQWGIEAGILAVNALKQCDENLVSAAGQIAAE